MTMFEWITGAISVFDITCIVLLVVYLLHELKNIGQNYYLLAVASLIYIVGQAIRRINLWRIIITTDAEYYKQLPFYHDWYIVGTIVSLFATALIAYIIIGRSMKRWVLLTIIYLLAVIIPFIAALPCPAISCP